MAPKSAVRAVMGSVVRTRTTLVQETVEVSVVQKTRPKEKKVVEVEVRDMEAEELPAPPPEVAPTAVETEIEVAAAPHPPLPAAEEPQTPAGEEKDHESEKETQPPLEPAAEEEDKKARAEGGKIEEVKEGEVEKQRRRRRRRTKAAGGGGSVGGRSRGYKRYVYRVLKQVHPELRVSSMAMTVLDSLVKDMFERLAEEAARLSKYSGKATLSSREIQGAVRLVLPGELGKHAVAEGSKAVANYMAAETSRR